MTDTQRSTEECSLVNHMRATSGTGQLTFCGDMFDVHDGLVTHWEEVTCPKCIELRCFDMRKEPKEKEVLPAHSSYKDAGEISIKSILEAKLTKDQLAGYRLGTALDYLLRCNFKDFGMNFFLDIRKAHDYLGWILDMENKKTEVLAKEETKP